MHGWGLLRSTRGNPSQTLISRGVGIGAKTISVLFFCISRNCRMNSVVCSRFVSKILLITFASTACLSVGNFDKACSIAFWTISRKVASTFLTSFSDRGSNLSTGLRSVIGLPLACTPIEKTEKCLTESFHWKTVLDLSFMTPILRGYYFRTKGVPLREGPRDDFSSSEVYWKYT